MARTSSIFARVEPELKNQAESILEQLGIPMSNAITMFLKQVVLQNGIPFEMKLPTRKPIVLEDLTEEQLNQELIKGLQDVEQGRTLSTEEVEREMIKLFEQ